MCFLDIVLNWVGGDEKNMLIIIDYVEHVYFIFDNYVMHGFNHTTYKLQLTLKSGALNIE